ncbi:patatin-like phospholipase family protein [Nitrobacter sp. JJSN]|uniref:patatin-like phospholipase family protein n=1 Tax=Nitrobacter sp. JJSN TaxID=3453033 RepID=UPI003F75B7FC
MTPPSNSDEKKFDTFADAEFAHIRTGRTRRLGVDETGVPWAGLGLSGGGIRSACLALGVLQVLAERHLLSRFDYISSVSGGGYIASSLQWWWAKKSRSEVQQPGETPKQPNQTKFGLTTHDFPYGSSTRPLGRFDNGSAAERGLRNLDFLRAHASYLTPGNELTIWSMLVVVLRTVAISLLIWLPLLVTVFAGWHYLNRTFFDGWAEYWDLSSPVGNLIKRHWNADEMYDCQAKGNCIFYLRAGYAGFIYIFYCALGLFGFVAVLYGFVSRAPQDHRSSHFVVATAFGAATVLLATSYYLAHPIVAYDTSAATILLVVALLATILLVWAIIEICTPDSLNPSYWLRRFVEKWLGKIFLPSMAFLAIGLVPIAFYYIGQTDDVPKPSGTGSISGVFSLLSGIASALYSYYVFIRNVVPSIAARIAATLGALIYLYGTLILAYWLSIAIVEAPYLISDSVDQVEAAGWCLAVIAFLLAIYGNINFVGLHRYYRDRLMEAFMPDDASVTAMRTRRSPVADNLSMTDLISASCAEPGDATSIPTPYPLINTNVILVKDKNSKFAARGGANFLISPLFVGSSATGWVDTATFVARHGAMTLPTAMAASGAAASASAGYIGTGITMNPVVAAVMSLLNIRLGLWIGNPANISSHKVRRIPTFFNPGFWSGVLGRGHRSTDRFLELTDGGHFENLAMYELVRRKLGVVLIVDGEADPQISLASLVSARNRIQEDFGARLEFLDDQGPELLVMHEARGYPVDAKYASSPFIVGRLTYNDNSTGTFIYIKSNVTPKLDFSIAGYLASNKNFPHQSTADQFFSPDQFDAYRNLGAASARKMIDTLHLGATICQPQAIIDTYVKCGPRS